MSKIEDLLEKIENMEDISEIEELTDEEIDMLYDAGVLSYDEDDEVNEDGKNDVVLELEKHDYLDNRNYWNGIETGMEYAGFITALQNIGLSNAETISVLDMHINKKLVELNNKTNIEISKINETNINKNIL